MPTILWTALASDLGRLLAMVSLTLVVLISFAAGVKPLADGDVGLLEALKLMGLLSVPMLQFALPFAAGFAATLSYHRFASDNEAVAAMAGGIGHRSLLAPAAAWGVGLALLVALLTNLAIPHFLRAAERMITRDLARLVVTPLERGQPLTMGDWSIVADDVFVLEPDESQGEIARILLQNVIGEELPPPPPPRARQATGQSANDNDGQAAADETDPPQYFAAESIVMFLRSIDDGAGDGIGGTEVDLQGRNVHGSAAGGAGFAAQWNLPEPIVIPTKFDDDPKYLTLPEMLRTLEQPRRMNKVERDALRLARALAEQRVVRAINDRLTNAPNRVLLTRRSVTADADADVADVEARPAQTESVLITGAGLALAGERGWRIVPEVQDAPVRIEFTDAAGGVRLHEAGSATLRLAGAGSGRDPASDDIVALAQSAQADAGGVRFVLIMRDVVTTTPAERGGQAGAPSERSELSYQDLALGRAGAESVIAEAQLTTAELLDRARTASAGPDALAERVARFARRYERRLDDVDAEIWSKLHERAAFTVATALMVVLGAVIAMRLRESLPLPVYLWSFFPALIAVITISSGQRMAHKSGAVGLLMLWGGVAALAALTAQQYARLRRH